MVLNMFRIVFYILVLQLFSLSAFAVCSSHGYKQAGSYFCKQPGQYCVNQQQPPIYYGDGSMRVNGYICTTPTDWTNSTVYGAYCNNNQQPEDSSCSFNVHYNNPNPTCTTGQTSTRYIKQSGPQTIYIGSSGPSISIAGCKADCETPSYYRAMDGSNDIYLQALCTTTGQQSAPTDPAAVDNPPNLSQSSSTTDGKTCSTIGGQTACVGGDIPANCTQINGQTTCPTGQDSSKIAEHTVKATDNKNCYYNGGNTICQVAFDDPDASMCVTLSGQKTCYSAKPTVNEETTTVTNPDGSVTTTTTQDSNVIGSNPVTTTKTTHPNGNVTVNRSGSVMDQTVLNDISRNTSVLVSGGSSSNSDTAKKLDEIKGKESDFDKSALNWDSIENAITSDRDGYKTFVEQANPFTNFFNNNNPIPAYFQSMLPQTTNCSGGIHTTIFGRNFDLEPCEKLLPLREILAWFFALFTAWQIFNLTSRAITNF